MKSMAMKAAVCLTALALSGCFTAMSHFMGASPSPGEQIVVGALDVVTLPAQVVVFGSMLIMEAIDANTGERGRQNRMDKERSALRERLDADFGLIYSDPDYLSPTNTLAREAVKEYFRHRGCNALRPDDVRRLAEVVASRHELAETLDAIWYRDEAPVESRMKAAGGVEANKEAHAHPEALIFDILCHDVVPDDELERLSALGAERPISAEVATKLLARRCREREEAARREEEHRARMEQIRAKAEDERLQRAGRTRRPDATQKEHLSEDAQENLTKAMPQN